MAIEYSFVLDSLIDENSIANWMATELSMRLVEDNQNHTVHKNGLVCTIMPQSALGRELIHEGFGIESHAIIVCRVDKFEQHSEAMETLVELCIALLKYFDVDMAMLSNGERGLVLRKEGQVYVDCEEEYWKNIWQAKFYSDAINAVERALPSL